MKLSVPSELPELKERSPDYFDRPRGNRGMEEGGE